jgi:hypothetical protein
VKTLERICDWFVFVVMACANVYYLIMGVTELQWTHTALAFLFYEGASLALKRVRDE